MIDTSNYVTLQEILGITVNPPITIQGATVVVPAGYRLTSSRVSIASQIVRPYALFVSNDQAFNGNYVATSDSFNNAPVYELTQ